MIFVWTGATSGVNLEAAEKMLMRSKHTTGSKIPPYQHTLVLIISDTRSIPSLQAVAQLKRAAENTLYHIESLACDLTNVDNAKQFARTVISRYGRVDRLILGVSIACWGPPSYTTEGTELGVTVNHLSQFCLIYHLRNHITDRIVMIASEHYTTAFRIKDFESSVAKSAVRPAGPLNLRLYLKYCDSSLGIGIGTTSALSAMCLNTWARILSCSIVLCTPKGSNVQAHSTNYIQQDYARQQPPQTKKRFNLFRKNQEVDVLLEAVSGISSDTGQVLQVSSCGRMPMYTFPRELEKRVWNWTCCLINEDAHISV